jgi:hypothetical protein
MISLVDIASGWYNYLNATPYVKKLIGQRLAICDSCPSKQQLTKMGQILVKSVNEEGNLFKCKECGCPLAAKTASLKSSCPLGKWSIAGTESYY